MDARFSPTLLISTLIMLVIAGCDSTASHVEWQTEHLALEFVANPSTVTYEVAGEITAVADDGGVLIVGTSQGAFGIFGTELLPLDVYQETDAPPSTGAIRALAQRDDGLLVAADNGLFHTEASTLLYSPISALLNGAQIQALSVVGTGAEETVWLATNEGLYRWYDNTLETIDIEGLDHSATAVAANKRWVIAAFGARLYEIDLDTWTSLSLTADFGEVESISATGDVFSIATNEGLIVRDASGIYTHYLVGTDSKRVTDTLVDATHGIVALQAEGAFVLESDTATGIAALDNLLETARLGTDSYGNIWVGSGTQLNGLLIGEQASFEKDVAPILQTHCASCHATGAGGAPVHDFSDYGVVKATSDAIVQRISLGNMPPSGPLGSDDTQIIVRWATTGQNP